MRGGCTFKLGAAGPAAVRGLAPAVPPAPLPPRLAAAPLCVRHRATAAASTGRAAITPAASLTPPLSACGAGAGTSPMRVSAAVAATSCRTQRASTRMHAAAKAAAPPVAAAAAEAWFTATGVPLLEALQQMTLQQAALKSAALVLATAVGVMVGTKLLDVMGTKMEAVAERTRSASGFGLLVGTGLSAVHRPAKLLLPAYGFFYTLLILTAFADVAVSRVDTQIHNIAHVCGYQLLIWLKGLAQVMQDTSELVLIIFLAWFLIAWKDEFITVITSKMDVEEGDEVNLTRVLVPLGNVLSWCIVVAAGLTTLTAFGINIQPVLAVGSISTVAVGFAAQSTMQNVVSALQIYSSRPFIVGDRVQLKSLSGAVIAAGVVEHIAPMRTVLRADNKLPTYISNKDVMNLIIVNESKLRRTNVAPKLPLIEATITLRYCDVDVLPQVEQAIAAYLEAHPLVDSNISSRCVLSEFTSAGPQLAFRALLLKSAASKQVAVRGQMLREAERLVRQCGGYLATAVEFGSELPPSPPSGPPSTGPTGPRASGEFGSTPAGP